MKVKYLRAILIDLKCRQEELTYMYSTFYVWTTPQLWMLLIVMSAQFFSRLLSVCIQILQILSAGSQFSMHRNYILGMSDAINFGVRAMVAYVTRA